MKRWEDLTFVQKTVIGLAIFAMAVFAPEIALLVQFGGIEVAFAFIAMYLLPITRLLGSIYQKLRSKLELASVIIQTSATAKPKVFFVQAAFCVAAFMLTGSISFAYLFFIPSMVLNGALI